jgi:small-conductance mechanosensitive channel
MLAALPLLLLALLAALPVRAQTPAATDLVAERRAALEESLARLTGEEGRIAAQIEARTRPVDEREVELAELEAALARDAAASGLEDVDLATLKARWQVQREGAAAELAAARDRLHTVQLAREADPEDAAAVAAADAAAAEVSAREARTDALTKLLASDAPARELVGLEAKVRQRHADLATYRANLLKQRHERERRQASREQLAEEARATAQRIAALEQEQSEILARRTQLEERLNQVQTTGATASGDGLGEEEVVRAQIDLTLLDGYRVSEEIATIRGHYTAARFLADLDERRRAFSPDAAPRRHLQQVIDEERRNLARLQGQRDALVQRRTLYQTRSAALDRQAELLAALKEEGAESGRVSISQRRATLATTRGLLDDHLAQQDAALATQGEYLHTLEAALARRHDVRASYRAPRGWDATTPAAALRAIVGLPVAVIDAMPRRTPVGARLIEALVAMVAGAALGTAALRIRVRTRRTRAALRERTVGHRGLRVVTAAAGALVGVAPATLFLAGILIGVRLAALPPALADPVTALLAAAWAGIATRVVARYLRWTLRGGRVFHDVVGRRRGWRWLVRLLDVVWLFLALRTTLVRLHADPAFIALLEDVAAAVALLFLPATWRWRPPVLRTAGVLQTGFGLMLMAAAAPLLLSLAGYHNLAGGIATWVGLVAGLGLLWLVGTLIAADAWQATLGPAGRLRRIAALRPDEANRLGRTVSRITSAAIAAGLFLWQDPTGALLASPLWEVLLNLLRRPILTFGGIEVSVASLLTGVAVFAAFLLVSRLVRRILRDRLYPRTRLDAGVRNAINNFINYGLLTLGVLVALQAVGIRLTTLTVFAGALGVGLGFGLQNIANNFVSGLILLIERPVKTGDYVDLGTTRGVVERIGARSTLIRTRDNIAIVVPNSEFIAQTVTNWSLEDPKTRIHVEVGVAYGSDPRRVEEILIQVAKDHPIVLDYPPPKVWFNDFGNSSLDFVLLAWVRDPATTGLHAFRSELRFAITDAFQEHGIEIPFPQRDLHLRSIDEKAAARLTPRGQEG